ncbi:hypothetical protein [Thiosulfativibrio zosterae]|uniref:hypothetical protein n=1 Tax=Thiosulfativibrio zosterae TaxID=2675053 RepID=UPI00156443CA|nr:hypothetical protein [Thiosulfativibrio zosterae]
MNLHLLKIALFFSVLVLITLGYWLLESADQSLPSQTPETLAKPHQASPTPIKPLPVPEKAPLAVPKLEKTTPEEPPLIIPQTFTLKSPDAQKELGPTMPGSTPNPRPIEKKLLHLPNSPSEETQQLNYGYEGKEQDKYKLNLGVTDGGVSLQTKLKTDQAAKQVELEGVEIEIKLPK